MLVYRQAYGKAAGYETTYIVSIRVPLGLDGGFNWELDPPLHDNSPGLVRIQGSDGGWLFSYIYIPTAMDKIESSLVC